LAGKGLLEGVAGQSSLPLSASKGVNRERLPADLCTFKCARRSVVLDGVAQAPSKLIATTAPADMLRDPPGGILMAVRPSDSRRRITRWAIIWAIPLILAAAPTAAKQYPDDLIWSRAPRPILQSSREYLLHGESVNGLCQYSYPDVQLPSAAATWEVDDIAISAGSCTKVVLEGKPEVTATSSAQDATVAAIERSSRYQQQLWYEDVLGITVTWSQTKVQWWWDGACALGGNTYRY
jgi:hypothetical protein